MLFKNSKMLHCFLCGMKLNCSSSQGSYLSELPSKLESGMTSIVSDLIDSEGSLMVGESDVVCISCKVLCIELDSIEYERRLMHKILKRLISCTYGFKNYDTSLCEIDRIAATEFNFSDRMYFCKKCDFRTRNSEEISPHYKYHCIEERGRTVETTVDEIEFMECCSPAPGSLSDNKDFSLELDAEYRDDIETKNSTNDETTLQSIKVESRNSLECPLCSFETTDEVEMEEHRCDHEENKTQIVTTTDNGKKKHRTYCDKCGFETVDSKVCDHSKALDLNLSAINCTKCDLIFFQKHLLMNHLLAQHFVCRHCGKIFSNKQIAQNHEKKHQKKQLYECSWCDKAFTSRYGLVFHTASHTGIYNYECETCGKKFAYKKGLDEHSSMHKNESRYICAICGKSFVYDASYRIHKKWHNDPFPAKCRLCPEVFRHPTILAKHRRVVHEGHIPEFACRTCNKKFSTSSSRRCHEMMHSGDYLYRCKICNRGFSKKSHLGVHMSRIHKDDSVLNSKSSCQYKVTIPPDLDKEYEAEMTEI